MGSNLNRRTNPYIVAIRTQIAWHEAGHVVAGLLIGCGLEQAYIEQTKRRIDGWTSHNPLLRAGMADRQMAILGFGGLVGELFCEAVAGIPVENSRRPMSETDLPFIRLFTEAEADEILEETNSLLSEYVEAIEWVANWLLEHELIDADTIEAHMPEEFRTEDLMKGLAVQREVVETILAQFAALKKAMAEHPELFGCACEVAA
jgi:hypothetical protein